jgi:hypothetical protein
MKAEFKAYPEKTPNSPPFFKGGDYLTFRVDDLFQGKTRGQIFAMKLGIGEPVKVTFERWSEHGTDAQNRLFHKLLSDYQKSGNSSFDTIQDTKDYLKHTFGEVGEMMYINGKPFFNGLKSWSQFTVNQRRKTIDGLIGMMLECGMDIDTEVVQWEDMKHDGKREVSNSGTESGDTEEGPLSVQVRTASRIFGSPDSPDEIELEQIR